MAKYFGQLKDGSWGFLDNSIHSADLIATATPIDDLVYEALKGKNVQPDTNGHPIVVDPPELSLDQLKTKTLKKIDNSVDDLYKDVIGNRASEYDRAEAEAKSFAVSGYPAGNVPESVQAWADPNNQTPTWAADDIIATAVGWRTVQANLRTKRLAIKEAVRSAVDQSSIDVVLADWNTFVAATRTSLNI
jgi:hypothetical protein